MFDRRGRMLCDKCQCPMKTLEADVGKATFECENQDCRHVLLYTWSTERAKYYAASPDKWKYR